MNILLVEPFFTGSHRKWAEGYQQASQHHVQIISLPGRHWKWRMYGGAVSLAKKLLSSSFKPDLLLVSDMLDLATFVALCRDRLEKVNICVYFHENQITYPWSPDDQDLVLNRNNQYGFINYTSALTADKLFFNSRYHLNSFINGLTPFLKQFPDHQELQSIDKIKQKSEVLYLGMNLKLFDPFKTSKNHNEPIILWNHRWEYDKNPKLFFESLLRLKEEKLQFKLIILGESYKNSPTIFEKIKTSLKEQIIHFGFATGFQQYAELLWQSDILPVTSNQDFFGGSVVEAIYCDCYPILPERLAYPEHISAKNKANHFYSTEEGFYQKLKDVVINSSQIQSDGSNKNFVARYDWSNLAPAYDKNFEMVKYNYL